MQIAMTNVAIYREKILKSWRGGGNHSKQFSKSLHYSRLTFVSNVCKREWNVRALKAKGQKDHHAL